MPENLPLPTPPASRGHATERRNIAVGGCAAVAILVALIAAIAVNSQVPPELQLAAFEKLRGERDDLAAKLAHANTSTFAAGTVELIADGETLYLHSDRPLKLGIRFFDFGAHGDPDTHDPPTTVRAIAAGRVYGIEVGSGDGATVTDTGAESFAPSATAKVWRWPADLPLRVVVGERTVTISPTDPALLADSTRVPLLFPFGSK